MWGARGFNRTEMPGDYQPGFFHRVDTSASTRPMLDSFDVSILVFSSFKIRAQQPRLSWA